jgi:hypothetical protein
MASTSALRAQKTTSAQANNGQAWGDLEALAEVLKTAIEAISVTIDPGNVTVGTVTANAGTNLNTSALATQTTLAAILTKLADPATQTTLAAVLAKQPNSPALETGGNLDSLVAKDFATQTSLALVKAKTDNLDVALSTRLKPADTLAGVTTVAAVTAITNALPAGTNNVGKVSPPSSTLVNSAAYEASHVLKASAGTLTYLSGYNSGPEQGILLFDSATVPADTAVPIKVIRVAAQSNFNVEIPVSGLPFATGLAVANSSTYPTKTIASADCYFTAVVL